MLPKVGVYASRVRIDDDAEWRDAVTAVTQTPTFEDVRARIETHILSFDGDIYGKGITVGFCRRLREECQFDSPEELRKQIEKDVKEVL